MIKLSVNINKVATLRNARGGKIPDVIQFAKDCENYGAEGITVHPRPDERHIRFADVTALKEVVKTEFNIEGYPSPEFIDLVLKVRPEQVTLVPDPPDAITSNAGWDTKKHQLMLADIIGPFKENGIRTSLFLNPKPSLVEPAFETGANRIELYTEEYSANFSKNPAQAIIRYVDTAGEAVQAGMKINAGHDLNLHNLKFFAAQVPGLVEVSIGHALICDALYFGIENTIQMYRRCLMKK
jgi:pyridoxine 5-phosphate synthase